jgi:hypothetical protein
MDKIKENARDEQRCTFDEEEAIDNALLQMEILYKCRCVQPPTGSNVTIREIKKDE